MRSTWLWWLAFASSFEVGNHPSPQPSPLRGEGVVFCGHVSDSFVFSHVVMPRLRVVGPLASFAEDEDIEKTTPPLPAGERDGVRGESSSQGSPRSPG